MIMMMISERPTIFAGTEAWPPAQITRPLPWAFPTSCVPTMIRSASCVIFNAIINYYWVVFILKVVTPAAGSRGGQSRPRLTGTLLENVVAAYSTMNRSLVILFIKFDSWLTRLFLPLLCQVPHTFPRACTQRSRLWSKFLAWVFIPVSLKSSIIVRTSFYHYPINHQTIIRKLLLQLINVKNIFRFETRWSWRQFWTLNSKTWSQGTRPSFTRQLLW